MASDELTALKERLTAAREERASYARDERRLEDRLAEAKNDRRRSDRMVKNLELAVHALEGAESGCDHVFMAEPSGRGIGYDERCRKCGYFKNLYPVF